MLLNYDPRHCLPSAEELPDSDDTPVDNELQDLIPHVLKDILALIWSERMDWYFGVDMGIYYNPLRKRKPRLEVYQLNNQQYELLEGEPVWLSEIGLGIGKEIGVYQGVEREWLYWYDPESKRYFTLEERALQAEERAKKLEEKLRSLGG